MTGNLVGLSGNVLYKFEALVGGIFLVFNAFKLTPDFSMWCIPGPVLKAHGSQMWAGKAPLQHLRSASACSPALFTLPAPIVLVFPLPVLSLTHEVNVFAFN